jgi:hypothetical protein
MEQDQHIYTNSVPSTYSCDICFIIVVLVVFIANKFLNCFWLQTYHDSVVVAGAGFAVVDSVVFISHFLIHLRWFQQAPMF